MKASLTTFIVALCLLPSAAFAQNIQPALIYGEGTLDCVKMDRSFNQLAYEGAMRFASEAGINFAEYAVPDPSVRETVIRGAAQNATIVITLGFSHAEAISTIAQEFPDVQFVLVDAVVALPNVRSILFDEPEGSFLVGMASGMATPTISGWAWTGQPQTFWREGPLVSEKAKSRTKTMMASAI